MDPMTPVPQRPFPEAPFESMEDRLLRAQRSLEQPAGPGLGWSGGVVRLGRFLRALGRPVSRPPLALADALPWLLPKVRPASAYPAFARRTGQPAPAFQLLAGDLAVSLVAAFPNRDLDLGAAQLQAWNADFDDLLRHARGNLLARSGSQGFREVRDGCHCSTWRDNLDGSRMLLPGILQELRIQGNPVVLLPNRNTLLVVGSEDPEGLRWAVKAALLRLDDDGCPMSACPLKLANYHWEPFRVPLAHPAGALLGAAEGRRLRDEGARRPVVTVPECC
jgi:hypothetical protein